ncbi:hypothetical protein BGZ96_001528 [Linnemannia gamsii]|uniref:ubiquitinyl hydrolase 1 n=1 Tax=Linnemannia gamsii TaxID=64522 RepID=A0ABQ7JMP3_9FUNG|nr:hypothetical protein BGZ96_001528 [Linnemannia gamsii]
MWRNGIRGAHIQELYSLDQSTFRSLANHHNPVYGFIFLIKPQGSRLSKVRSLEQQPAFSNVYFAQQVIPDACGTQAILSIALNSEEQRSEGGYDGDGDGLDIGPLLRNFKDFTTGFSPLTTTATRPAVRTNGRGDKKTASKPVQNPGQKAPKKRKSGASGKDEPVQKKRSRPSRPAAPTTVATTTTPASDSVKEDIKASSLNDVSDDEDLMDKEDDYHYIAYVHIDGYIWELDGLQPEPIRLAACTRDEWVNEARLEFRARVLSFDDDEQSFVLMAMTKDPLITLSQRIHSLQHSSLSPKEKEQQQQREELRSLEETLRREEMDREAEKSAIQEMEADYRPALEFFMQALTSLDHPPDHHSDVPMDIGDNGVISK